MKVGGKQTARVAGRRRRSLSPSTLPRHLTVAFYHSTAATTTTTLSYTARYVEPQARELQIVDAHARVRPPAGAWQVYLLFLRFTLARKVLWIASPRQGPLTAVTLELMHTYHATRVLLQAMTRFYELPQR